MSDFWDTDKPTTVDEAMQLLRFGAVQFSPDAEYRPAIARTERRMANSAKYLEGEMERFKAQRDAAGEALREACLTYAAYGEQPPERWLAVLAEIEGEKG